MRETPTGQQAPNPGESQTHHLAPGQQLDTDHWLGAQVLTFCSLGMGMHGKKWV